MVDTKRCDYMAFALAFFVKANKCLCAVFACLPWLLSHAIDVVSCIFWFSTTEMNPTGYFIHRSKKISVLCNQSTRCISKNFIVMVMINNLVFVDECGILVFETLCFSNSNSNAPKTKEINCRYDNLHQQDDPIDVSFYLIHFRKVLCSLIFLFSMSFFSNVICFCSSYTALLFISFSWYCNVL